MTLTALKERLHDMIDDESDAKVLESVQALLEGQAIERYEWSEDKQFVAELDERWRRYEAGIDKAYTMDEVKERFDKLRAECSKNQSGI